MKKRILLSNGKKAQKCLESRTIRWDFKCMPIPVYIAPVHWYDGGAAGKSAQYTELVLKAMRAWTDASGGAITFRQVEYPLYPGITVRWPRSNRFEGGVCHWSLIIRNRIRQADIEIGLSDQQSAWRHRNDDDVYHVILHEFGHALGLDHTEYADDIMAGFANYDVVEISANDANVLKMIYELPPGFDYEALGKKLEVPEPYWLDQVMAAYRKELDKEKPPIPSLPQVTGDIDTQMDLLRFQGEFYCRTQHLTKPVSEYADLIQPYGRGSCRQSSSI